MRRAPGLCAAVLALAMLLCAPARAQPQNPPRGLPFPPGTRLHSGERDPVEFGDTEEGADMEPQWTTWPDVTRAGDGVLSAEEVTAATEPTGRPPANDGSDVALAAFLPAPKLFTRADLLVARRAILAEAGVTDAALLDAKITPAELAVLAATNEALLTGSPDGDLRRNLALLSGRVRLVDAAEAAALDGRPLLRSPMEDVAMELANEARLSGKGERDPRKQYRLLLAAYDREQALKDAQGLYDAMKGAGTDEAVIMGLLTNRTVGEVEILVRRFDQVLREKGESTSCDRRTYSSCLEEWLDGDMDNGWFAKAKDALESRPVLPDSEYHWISAAALWVNQQIKSSDASAKRMLETESGVLYGVAVLNQWIFGAAGAANEAVKTAVTYYEDLAANTDSTAVKAVAHSAKFLAVIGGSFGTKALDPSLSVEETEEGLVDVALLLGGAGAGKLAGAAARTPAGLKALSFVATQHEKAMVMLFRVSGRLGDRMLAAGVRSMAQRAQKLEAALAKATKAGKTVKADRLTDALHAVRRAKMRGEELVRAMGNVKNCRGRLDEMMKLHGANPQHADLLAASESYTRSVAHARAKYRASLLARREAAAAARLGAPNCKAKTKPGEGEELVVRSDEFDGMGTTSGRKYARDMSRAVDQVAEAIKSGKFDSCTQAMDELAKARRAVAEGSSDPRFFDFGARREPLKRANDAYVTGTGGRYSAYQPRLKELTGGLGEFSPVGRLPGPPPVDVPLTTGRYVDGNTIADVWIHVDPVHVPAIEKHVDTLFKKSMRPEVQPDEVVRLVAEMQYWLSHAMPYKRGSAAVTDAFAKSVLRARGIQASRWAQGVLFDLEAFVRPVDDYVRNFRTFFEKPF